MPQDQTDKAEEAEVQDQVHRWQAERLQHQQEIHRLRAQAAVVEEEAVPV